MKDILADHSSNLYLKPGETLISPEPIVVSTILGSCVAVTMYCPIKKIGVICHAMYPCNPRQTVDVQYVDSAIHYIYKQITTYSWKNGLIVKLFGGAQVLTGASYDDSRQTVGEQNVRQAEKTLRELGLPINCVDTGGTRGRKLLFSVKTGDVYVRRLGVVDQLSFTGA